MPTNILMPALSPTMTEGNLAKWLKKEGDKVKSGDVIAEIETDKATMEVEAADEGTMGKIVVPAGTAGVKVNAIIAVLLNDGEKAADIKLDAPANEPSKKAQEKEESKAPAASTSVQGAVQATHSAPVKTSGRIAASPLARRLAEQKGINLSTLRGSGPNGRIVKADVESAKPGVGSGATRPMTAAGPDARALADMLGMAYTAIPNSGMRKTIASRLQESKQTVPHFYLTVECRIDALLAARKAINERDEAKKVKLSVNDFVIKAVAMALAAYPAANAAWTEDAILQYQNADISVAVATPNGLITPIVKAAEGKTLAQISGEVKDLATRARDGKLKPTEYQGGSFTISNLGMYGIKEFGAIINPPQACILAVGAGIEQPVVEGGRLTVGTVMSCTLSVDHRAVDGAVGAEFLKIFKSYIENPILMLA